MGDAVEDGNEAEADRRSPDWPDDFDLDRDIDMTTISAAATSEHEAGDEYDEIEAIDGYNQDGITGEAEVEAKAKEERVEKSPKKCEKTEEGSTVKEEKPKIRIPKTAPRQSDSKPAAVEKLSGKRGKQDDFMEIHKAEETTKQKELDLEMHRSQEVTQRLKTFEAVKKGEQLLRREKQQAQSAYKLEKLKLKERHLHLQERQIQLQEQQMRVQMMSAGTSSMMGMVNSNMSGNVMGMSSVTTGNIMYGDSGEVEKGWEHQASGSNLTLDDF
ncbi:hypothetical protein MPER_09594 [Moniliophthora perniciosa FA553]|nr:hypothetical protein MPER_09594 [Moniliophthora perniciosa FA553]